MNWFSLDTKLGRQMSWSETLILSVDLGLIPASHSHSSSSVHLPLLQWDFFLSFVHSRLVPASVTGFCCSLSLEGSSPVHVSLSLSLSLNADVIWEALLDHLAESACSASQPCHSVLEYLAEILRPLFTCLFFSLLPWEYKPHTSKDYSVLFLIVLLEHSRGSINISWNGWVKEWVNEWMNVS